MMNRQQLLETTENLITTLDGCDEAKAVVALLKESKAYLKPVSIVLSHGKVYGVDIAYKGYIKKLLPEIDYNVKYKK
jgi:hypothetical protein